MTYQRNFSKNDTTVPLMEQKLLPLPEFTTGFCGVRVAQSWVFCLMFYRSLSVLFLLAILLAVQFTASDYPFNWDLQIFLTCRRHDRSVNVYTLHLLNGYEACLICLIEYSCSWISVGRLFHFLTVLTKGLYFLWSSIDLSLIEGHECGVVWLILLREPESPSLSLLHSFVYVFMKR